MSCLALDFDFIAIASNMLLEVVVITSFCWSDLNHSKYLIRYLACSLESTQYPRADCKNEWMSGERMKN